MFLVTTLAIYLGLPLLGWGVDDLAGFLSLSPRAGYALAVVAVGLAVGCQAMDSPEGVRGGKVKGEEGKLVRRQSVVRVAVILLMYGALIFLPFSDRRAIAVMIGGEVARWIGLVFFGLGSTLVFWSGLALGRLYSPEVTLQAGHRLITSGPYRHLRHPRYLGGIIYACGLSLLFRSWIGMVGCVLALGFFWFRVRDEEALMCQEFGQEWEAYCQRSWRLIPFLY